MSKSRNKKRGYKSKRKNNSNGLGILVIFIVLYVVIQILKVIEENPEIIIAIMMVPVAIVILISLIRYHYNIQLENRKLEIIKNNRTIKQLLITYKDCPTDFEHYVASVFECIGYKTEVTTPTKDCGKDIIMYKDKDKYVVEVKLYKESNKISRGLIQKLHSAKIDSNANKAIFVTTSSYSKESIDFAEKHRINLLDGQSFVQLIEKALGEKEKGNEESFLDDIIGTKI